MLAGLIGLMVTSLFRAPNPAWTPLTAAVVLVVAVLLVRSIRGARRGSHRP